MLLSFNNLTISSDKSLVDFDITFFGNLATYPQQSQVQIVGFVMKEASLIVLK